MTAVDDVSFAVPEGTVLGMLGPNGAGKTTTVRMMTTLTVPTSGSYRFRTVSDDGVRLWIGGTQRINNWTDHGPTTDTGSSVSLSAGQRVSIKLEYYEKGGGATVRLQWLTPGSSSYVAVPLNRLNAQ